MKKTDTTNFSFYCCQTLEHLLSSLISHLEELRHRNKKMNSKVDIWIVSGKCYRSLSLEMGIE
jgi:hypothetical protein